MLALRNDSIFEIPINQQIQAGVAQTITTTGAGESIDWAYHNANNCVQWNTYPVYVCTDKTKKAIDILKALQSEKQIDCKSVPQFIRLIEKIAEIL